MAAKTALNFLMILQTALLIIVLFLGVASPIDFRVKFPFPVQYESKSSESSVLTKTVNKITGTIEGKWNELKDCANVHFILRNQFENPYEQNKSKSNETESEIQASSDFIEREILSFHTNSKYYSVCINNPRLFLYKNSGENSNSNSRSISNSDDALCQNFESERDNEKCFWHRSKYFLKHVSSFELVIFQLDELLDFLQAADDNLISKLNQRVSNRNLHIFTGDRKSVETFLETRPSSRYFRFLDKIRVKIGVDGNSGDIYSPLFLLSRFKSSWLQVQLNEDEKLLDNLILSWRFNSPQIFRGKFISFGIFAARHHYMPLSNPRGKGRGKGPPTKFIGASYNFIVGAASMYNFTYTLNPQPLENEFDPTVGKYTGYLQSLIDEKFDIFGYHAVPPMSEVNTSTTTFAYISSIKFLVSKPPVTDSLSNWKVVLAPFSQSVWILLTVTSVVIGFIFGFYKLPWDTSFAVLLNQSINLKVVERASVSVKQRRHNSDDDVHLFNQNQHQSQGSALTVISSMRSASFVPKSLAVLWILVSIIIVNYYNSDLLSILTIPKKEKYPETFSELLERSTLNKKDERHFHVNLMTMPGRPDSFLLRNSTYPFFATGEERDARFVDGNECVAKVLTEKRRACIGFYTIITPILANLLTIHRNIQPCEFSTNDAFSAAVSASVKKNSRYEGAILELLGYIRDTGHIERWKDDVTYHAQGLSIRAHTRSSKKKYRNLRKIKNKSKNNKTKEEDQGKEDDDEDEGPYENVEKLPFWSSVHKYLYNLLHEKAYTAKSISSSLYSIVLGLLAVQLFVAGPIFMCEKSVHVNIKLSQKGISKRKLGFPGVFRRLSDKKVVIMV